jgi:hypothetical protein
MMLSLVLQNDAETQNAGKDQLRAGEYVACAVQRLGTGSTTRAMLSLVSEDIHDSSGTFAEKQAEQ